MRAVIAIAFLMVLPGFVLAQDKNADPKPKRTTVTEILEAIPKTLLPTNLVWKADDLLEVSKYLKLNSPGKKMVILMEIQAYTVGEKFIAIAGPLKLLEFTKIDYRGKPNLFLRPYIHIHSYLKLPLSDLEKVKPAKKGSTLRLEATTGLVTLDAATADVFFDANLGKTVLLEVQAAK